MKGQNGLKTQRLNVTSRLSKIIKIKGQWCGNALISSYIRYFTLILLHDQILKSSLFTKWHFNANLWNSSSVSSNLSECFSLLSNLESLWDETHAFFRLN